MRHCQRFLPSQISDTLHAGFEPAQNLSSGFIEWSCAVVITATPGLRLAGGSKKKKRFYKHLMRQTSPCWIWWDRLRLFFLVAKQGRESDAVLFSEMHNKLIAQVSKSWAQRLGFGSNKTNAPLALYFWNEKR